MSEEIQHLATRPVGRLLWHYSLPAVVGMVVMALYNIVDRMFVGQEVGAIAMAGMAVTFPLMNLVTAIGVLVGAGASTRISIVLGAGDKPRAEAILGNAAVLTLINAAAYIAVFALFIDPILLAFGASDVALPVSEGGDPSGMTTLEAARTYMLWVLPGLLLTNVAFGLNNVLRSTGYPRRAMVTMLIGAVVNIVLDAVFVLGLGWGLMGAAVATDIAMLASAWFVIVHFFKPGVTLGFRRGTYRLRRRVVWDIVALGAPPAIVNAASCFINVLINVGLRKAGGDMAIGAAGVFVTYTSLLTSVLIGINMGLQPIIGYNYGAGLYHRLRRVLYIAAAAATVICTLGSVAGLTCAEEIARAFTSNEVLIHHSVECLHNAMWAFSVVGIPIVATCFFQSIGAPRQSMLLSLARQVLFLIPLMLLLPTVIPGVKGIWMSFPLSDLVAFSLSVYMVGRRLASYPARAVSQAL